MPSSRMLLPRRVWRHVSIWKVLIGLLLLTAIYNEVLCYWLATWSWNSLPTTTHPQQQLRVLFVADPQLVGSNDAPPAMVRPVTQLDCDRYLAKTYAYAVQHVRPDVVVFLGDLLDEGSRADQDEFSSYVRRFNAVFPKLPTERYRVVIPGDNDIGGEGGEFKGLDTIKRFNQRLAGIGDKTDSVSLQQADFLDFYSMNLDDMNRIPDVSAYSQLKSSASKTGEYSVMLNHYDVSPRFSVGPLLQELGSDLIFSAHNHKSAVYSCSDCWTAGTEDDGGVNLHRYLWQGHKMSLTDNTVISFKLHRSSDLNTEKKKNNHNSKSNIVVTEIAVPTCSYRMGVPQMGYGAALFDTSSGKLHYTVLWLPRRYRYLFSYVAVLASCALMLLARCLYMVLCWQRLESRSSSSFQRPALLPLYARDD